jgi:ATP-binding cassette subfamily F protein 3
MLNVSNLSVLFSGNYLFKNISFSIGNNERIGLIGKNGSGKTTLLKIIAGIHNPDEGLISYSKDYKIGFLQQELSTQSSRSIFDEVKISLTEIELIKNQIKEIEKTLETEKNNEKILDISSKLEELHYRFNILGGNQLEAEIEQTLLGLGFNREDFIRPVDTFSGGWRMRIELAKILLSKPDLIMLDEPTNHLDLDSLLWLERFLINYFGSVTLVSHDTKFMDNVSNRTIEISNKKIYDFKLSYYDFINFREKQLEEQRAAYNSQQKEIDKIEKFISKFRYKSTLASRVQSRIKQLDKIQRIELDEIDTNSINLRFPPVDKSTLSVCEAINLTKYYDDKLILENLNFNIHRGDRIAFVGKNGEGKTTLSKILAKGESFEGKLYYGNYLQISYFSQLIYESLNPDNTIFDELEQVATNKSREEIRTILGAFLFQADDIFKRISVLSGGEKSRVALAKNIVKPVNFLIMDEPTNHLDIYSKAVLKDALMNYDGTLIIVSHDREFLSGLTDQVWEIRNHSLFKHAGDIDSYLEKTNSMIVSQSIISSNREINSITRENNNQKVNFYDIRKSIKREIERINKSINKLEEEISILEKQILEIEKDFNNPDLYNDNNLYLTKQKEYALLKIKLDETYNSWQEEHLRLEEKNNEFEKLE